MNPATERDCYREALRVAKEIYGPQFPHGASVRRVTGLPGLGGHFAMYVRTSQPGDHWSKFGESFGV